jgi:hypothetical protein
MSKLPQMGRSLRTQEKGNIVGVAGLLGMGKETVEGRREVQVCTPRHCIAVTELRMLTVQPFIAPFRK